MRLLALLLLPGCAATFHRYHEVDFIDGSHATGEWTCSKRGAMQQPKLYCYDASKAVIVLPPSRGEAVKL